ncbi:glycosyltransferase [Pseudoalteromonas sp. Of7M-16]|uniref:glycosyltransferase family protein n=1 Tax=Pseudoalteromonas sp. Of7M-16 TaxID=2917756 RepID=UPI001EF5AB6F|nr:glycosyltransferase [Pseudoalteromonas sp. Of7M-16]MCG7547201.1 glycosyltransferase [Pseudoalteromonas sp. Of7M-16]
MKILYNRYKGSGNMTQWQAVNYIDEWQRAGYEIEYLEVNYSDKEGSAELISSTLLGSDFDIFISACDDQVMTSDVRDAMKKKGVPSLLICFDNLSVPFKHKKCSTYFDLVWLTSHETKYLFDKWGANTMFMPYAANPFTYQPTSGEELSGMAFVGTVYGGRINKVEEILKRDIDVRLYGGNSPSAEGENPAKNLLANLSSSLDNVYRLSSFPIGRQALKAAAIKSTKKFEISDSLQVLIKNRSSLSFEEVAKTYSRSKMSLNITELWNTYLLAKPIHKLHLRTFEIPMSGGLQIASRTDEIQDYFEEDKEIVLYDSMDEFVEKSRFYLRDDNAALREQIKHAARERAASEHSWQKRFLKAFAALGVK